MAMKGMPAMQAVQTYSILTIGNGLVSQIPALLISISAGMVVTRVASENADSNLGKDVATQILAQPKAISVASGMLFVMALIPGLPKIPFFLLAGLTGSVSYGLFRAIRIKKDAAEEAGGKQEKSAAASAEPEVTLTVPLVMELSQQITAYVDPRTEQGKKFYEMLVQIRNTLYYESGVIFPPIRISGNLPYQGGTYMIWMNEVPLVTGQVRLDALMVNDTPQNIRLYGIKGEDAENPATGKKAAWITRDQKEQAQAAGLQTWDVHEILIMHLTRFLKKHSRDFLGVQEVQWMLNTIKQYYPTLLEEVVPKPVTLQQLTEILQRLVEEDVSIRDLKAILQSLSEWARTERDTMALTEHVRVALRRKICYQVTSGRPLMFAYQLDPEVEEMFRDSVRQSAAGPYLAMPQDCIQQVMAATYAQIGNLPSTAQRPVVLVDSDIRRFVRRLLEYSFPDITALSYEESTPEINVQPLGMIAPVKDQQKISTPAAEIEAK